MKKFLGLFALLLSLPCIGFATQSSSFIKDKRLDKNSQVLFVMLSKEASIRATNKQDVYKLTLKGVNSKVIYFSNRPERISGQVGTSKFVAQWKTGSFNKVAPNAMIEAVNLTHTNKLQNTESSYAVTLYNPVAVGANELTFDVKALPGSHALPKMANSDYVAIFVDDYCITCIGG